MKLSEVKEKLNDLNKISFQLPNGELVPSHFHVTEIGEVSKKFIDCGGNLRSEKLINFQLWNANDYNHRLHPEKLQDIIAVSENALNLKDLEVEVEYQGETIGRFGLDYFNNSFQLVTKKTDCLAKDKCGIEPQKIKISLAELGKKESGCCDPNSNCC